MDTRTGRIFGKEWNEDEIAENTERLKAFFDSFPTVTLAEAEKEKLPQEVALTEEETIEFLKKEEKDRVKQFIISRLKKHK